MNSRGRKSEDEDDFEAKRRKLAEAVPALARLSNSVGNNRSMDEDIDVEQVEEDKKNKNRNRASPASPKAASMPKKRKDEKP